MLPFCKRMSICFATSVEEPFEPPPDKTNNMAVRPAKTQIILGIRPVWSESSLSAWRKVGTLATHWTHNEGSEMSEIESEAFNVIAIKLVVILNHFPGNKTVFYGIYLTLWLKCTLLVSTDSD